MWNLEPDLDWMSEPRYTAAQPNSELTELLLPHVGEIFSEAYGSEAKQLDPITTAILIAALSSLTLKVVDSCWEHSFKRATYNPFYHRKCVKALAAQLDKKGVQSPREVAAATLDHFRRMDKEDRNKLFAQIRAAA